MKVKSVYKEYQVDGQYDHYYIGKQSLGGVTIVSLEYHEPRGEGDAHYVDVKYSNGNVDRIFRPDSIEFEVE